MPALTEAVGFLASLVSFLVLLPQGVRVWADRGDPPALAQVALPTQAMLLLNSVLWAVYAALTGSFWVGAPVVVNAPITIVTIVVVLRSRRVAVVAVRSTSASTGPESTGPASTGPAWIEPAWIDPLRVPREVSESALVSVASG